MRLYDVHVKSELGRDDVVRVEAESELAAERAVMDQDPTVAVAIDAFPVDPPASAREAEADGAAVDEASRLDASSASSRSLSSSRLEESLDAVRADAGVLTLVNARLALDDALAAGEVPGAAGVIEELNQVEADLNAHGPEYDAEFYADMDDYRAAEEAGLFDDHDVEPPDPDALDASASVSVACAAAAAAAAGEPGDDLPGEPGDEYDQFLDSGGSVEELAAVLSMDIGDDDGYDAAIGEEG